MMNLFFNMHSNSFTKERQELGIQGINHGNQKIDDGMRSKIQSSWVSRSVKEDCALDELRDHFLSISKELNVDLLSVWKAVKDLEKDNVDFVLINNCEQRKAAVF